MLFNYWNNNWFYKWKLSYKKNKFTNFKGLWIQLSNKLDCIKKKILERKPWQNKQPKKNQYQSREIKILSKTKWNIHNLYEEKQNNILIIVKGEENKSHIRETLNLLTCADSSTNNIYFFACLFHVSIVTSHVSPVTCH